MKMCPHCGELFPDAFTLVPSHDWPKPCRSVCPGTDQAPRNPETDTRTLWSGEPNPHLKLPRVNGAVAAKDFQEVVDAVLRGLPSAVIICPARLNPHDQRGDVVQVDADGFPVALTLAVPEELLNDSETPTATIPPPNRVRDLPQADFEILLRNGCFTLNEYRERYNLPPLEGPRGGEPYNPAEVVNGVVPLPVTAEEAEAAGLFDPGAYYLDGTSAADPVPYIRGPAASE